MSTSLRRNVGNKKVIPIAPIIEYYGGQIKYGTNRNVKCLFHNDSRSSAVVDTNKNVYFCHTCNIGVSSVGIICIKEGLNKTDAYRRAKEILNGSGISLPEQHGRNNKPVPRRAWDT